MINVICDLDGVIYLGDTVIEGVPQQLRRLVDAGVRLVFVTNNSSKTPAQVAAKVQRLTGVSIDPDDVCTSPQSALGLLGPEDIPVFVVGEEGISSVLEDEGIEVTSRAGEAGSVMVGLTPRANYQWIADAADAVRRGARFVATNTDSTYPSADGIKPGAGSIVAAIAVAAGVEPEVAGKPLAPMRDLVKKRIDGPAWVIGDRVDTDIAMAIAEPEWRSILVLSGVTTEAAEGVGADHVVADFAAAVDLVLETAQSR